MNRILFTIILFSLSFSVFAKSDLSKKEKAIVKSLKKQYKLEIVEIERPHDGFVYYSLITKDVKWMIADSTGTVIIPQSKSISDAYPNPIKFVAGHEKGIGNFLEKGRYARTISAYHPGNEPVFLTCKRIGGGSNEYDFFSTKGQHLSSFDGTISEASNAPVYVCKDLAGSYGLMAKDGRILLPNDYTSIETCSDGICILTQLQNGIERKGGACISDLTEVQVPCIFNSVNFLRSNECWLVQIHELDPISEYDESQNYDTSFLDEGQRLFELKEYEEAKKYYTLKGDNAKWANFFIGATYYMSVIDIYQEIKKELSTLENSSEREDRHIATNIRFNLKNFKSETDKAEQSLQAYLEGDHTQFAYKARDILYELSKIKDQANNVERRLDKVVDDFDYRCAEIKRMEQLEYDRKMERLQIGLEQQRIQEMKLAREQKEREMQMRKMVEIERKLNEVKKEEDKRKTSPKRQQNTHQQSQTNQQPLRPGHQQNQQPQRFGQQQQNQQPQHFGQQQQNQQPQRFGQQQPKSSEQKANELKKTSNKPQIPKKKKEMEKSRDVE